LFNKKGLSEPAALKGLIMRYLPAQSSFIRSSIMMILIAIHRAGNGCVCIGIAIVGIVTFVIVISSDPSFANLVYYSAIVNAGFSRCATGPV